MPTIPSRKFSVTTYYAILEISETATQKEIRVAYRKLLKKVHPDTVANLSPELQRHAEVLTQKIIEAYSVLSNADQRAEYDRYLSGYASAGCVRERSSAATARSTSRPSVDHRHSPPYRRRRRKTMPENREEMGGGQLKVAGVALLSCFLLGVLVPCLVCVIAAFLSQVGNGTFKNVPSPWETRSNDLVVAFAVLELPFLGLLSWMVYNAHHKVSHSPHERGWMIGIWMALVLNAIYMTLVMTSMCRSILDDDSSQQVRPAIQYEICDSRQAAPISSALKSDMLGQIRDFR